jgi:hypothetical protein
LSVKLRRGGDDRLLKLLVMFVLRFGVPFTCLVL